MKTCKDCKYRFIALGGESYCDYVGEDGLDICPDDGIILNIEKDTCKLIELVEKGLRKPKQYICDGDKKTIKPI